MSKNFLKFRKSQDENLFEPKRSGAHRPSGGNPATPTKSLSKMKDFFYVQKFLEIQKIAG